MMPAKVRRIERALEAFEGRERACDLCPRDCRVDRTRGATGYCRSGARAEIAQALLHYGEEPVLSGTAGPPAGGSGTIFFAGCNLKCLFCQNYQISWLRQGRPVPDEELAELMLALQKRGAFNINLVSPSHFLLPILRALRIAFDRGLEIPVVYNSNGYEKAEIIERLAGIVDVYLPDLKYASAEPARRYSGAPDYFEKATAAVQEMYVQQPDLIQDERGLALRGLIIRHLVLPGWTGDSLAVLKWIRESLAPSVPVSLMSQYHPCHEAPADIRRPLTAAEYRTVAAAAANLGFEHLFLQPEGFAPEDHLMPDFDRDEPFKWK